jgi:phosphatidylglycerol lysyltransferase
MILGTTWLLAPSVNHLLSDRLSLISQYETAGQPYALFFRLGDFLAGSLLAWLAVNYYKYKLKSLPLLLLIIIGVGMALDPVFTTTCHVSGSICQERFSLTFLVHAIETIITALALVLLSLYDAKVRHKLVSVVFVIFQIAYGVLFLTQYSNHEHFNTASQYLYQCVIIIWLAWFVRDYLLRNSGSKHANRWTIFIRYSVALWTLLNGFLAIILSLADINLLGRIKGLYFAGNNAWLAQHGVIVGVIMLYLSRHILRGERRARQLLLAIIGIETLKFSVITPNLPLALLYGLSFCLLFVMVDDFRRGTISMTWQVRLKDLAYMLCVLLVAVLLALVILDRDTRVSRIASRSFRHLTYSDLYSDTVHHYRTPKESIWLAHTSSTFILVSTITILWVLFRPYRLPLGSHKDFTRARSMLELYSDSPEDYFKFWPPDKQYFWDETSQGFIAYKVVGSVAFALADPISTPEHKLELLEKFVEWARTRRLKACFLPVEETNLNIYKELNTVQIGASALIDTDIFLEETAKDKWWRWKQNHAAKQGYQYIVSRPPHSTDFLKELKRVSDDWLSKSGHKERGFALGYFNQAYLKLCTVHYLEDHAGRVVAFTNQLPDFNKQSAATVDLMRHRTIAGSAMPYLLSKVIATVHAEGYKYFDLGFVPFASAKGPLKVIGRAASTGRFSAKGLEQFKNKFKPAWQHVYLAYDGDLADLASIALSIEAAIEKI